jgi:hypothetical protein
MTVVETVSLLSRGLCIDLFEVVGFDKDLRMSSLEEHLTISETVGGSV